MDSIDRFDALAAWSGTALLTERRALCGGGLLVAALVLLMPQQASAAGFSVSPVRLFLGEADRAAALRVSNDGTQDLRLQVELQAWSQDEEGQDRLSPSDDLIVSPVTMRVPPRSEQVVRLIVATPRDPQRQMTYRLLLREQRPAPSESEPAPNSVPISLVLSLPVFLTPQRAQHGLHCELGSNEGGSSDRADPFSVVCANHGTAHVRMGRLEIDGGSSTLARYEGSLYLLAGTRRRVPMGALSDVMDLRPDRPARTLRAWLDGGQVLQWTVSPADDRR